MHNHWTELKVKLPIPVAAVCVSVTCSYILSWLSGFGVGYHTGTGTIQAADSQSSTVELLDEIGDHYIYPCLLILKLSQPNTDRKSEMYKWVTFHSILFNVGQFAIVKKPVFQSKYLEKKKSQSIFCHYIVKICDTWLHSEKSDYSSAACTCRFTLARLRQCI